MIMSLSRMFLAIVDSNLWSVFVSSRKCQVKEH